MVSNQKSRLETIGSKSKQIPYQFFGAMLYEVNSIHLVWILPEDSLEKV